MVLGQLREPPDGLVLFARVLQRPGQLVEGPVRVGVLGIFFEQGLEGRDGLVVLLRARLAQP